MYHDQQFGSVAEGTPEMLPPDEATVKQGFSLFPSGVVVVTTVDREGVAHGFTASTFVPLSLDPPMILVCLHQKAQCREAFLEAEFFAASVLRPSHKDVAIRFATSGVDKFAGLKLGRTAKGIPVLEDALATFECRAAHNYPGGDHIILTGVIEGVRHAGEREAMVHFARGFHQVRG